jgi:3-phenylpropionate/cinnamic acid dioxygenase small subunit
VIVRYAWAYDEADFDAMEALFTDEATLDVSEPTLDTVRGRDAIIAFQRTARDGRRERGEQPRHLVNNVRIVRSDAASADVMSYMTLVLTAADGTASVVLAGTYDDRFVRSGDAWLIASRRIGFDRHRIITT